MPPKLYAKIDEEGKVPWWVSFLWPRTHFCPEFDYLLVTPDMKMEQQCCTCYQEDE